MLLPDTLSYQIKSTEPYTHYFFESFCQWVPPDTAHTTVQAITIILSLSPELDTKTPHI